MPDSNETPQNLSTLVTSAPIKPKKYSELLEPKRFWIQVQQFFRRMASNRPNTSDTSPTGSPLPPPPPASTAAPVRYTPSNVSNNGINQNGTYQVNVTASPPPSMKHMRKKGLPWILGALIATILVLLLLLSYALFKQYYQNPNSEINTKSPRSNWPMPKQDTNLAKFRRAAVVSDNGLCSEIGRTVLFKGGNAIDAAIATTVCVGALNAHSSGIGGYKAIAVPGELHGYWTAFKRLGSGRISWQDLIIPTVQILNNGYPVSKLMEANLGFIKDHIMAEPTMKNFFINNATNELYKEGEILKNPQLADTLRKLALHSDPVKLFYNGEMGKQIAEEIGEKNGYLTKKDLEAYRSVLDDQPLLNDHFDSSNPLVICGPKPSSSFAITQLIISIMSRFYPIGSNAEVPYSDPEYYHRFIEAQKFAYAQRTFLGDPKFIKNYSSENLTKKAFVNEIVKKITDSPLNDAKDYGGDPSAMVSADAGTSHISVIDADGNAVSLTSSINNVFGAVVRSEKLGIIWNDQMDDFSLPGQTNFFGFQPSPNNFIEPGKRPMSSMSPLIIYNKDTKQVKASLGASGGSKIISALAQVVLQTLNFNNTIKESIEMPRLHNQYTPFETFYEKEFSQSILSSLRERGHKNVEEMKFPFASVQAIIRSDSDGLLYANNDYRRKVYNYPTGY